MTSIAGTGTTLAQQTEETSSSATSLDRISVTGSRIKRADIEGALPVVVIDREQLEASGDVSVSDYLRNTSLNSFGSYQSTSGSSGAGFSSISLCGLGTARTLVLIDSRRAPTAPTLGNSQDLNSIPIAAIERIEVLSDGASAIYGSDALGSVVNIITRKDYDGAEFTYGVGRPTEDGGDTEEMSFIIGAASDRGRVLAGACYTNRDIVFTRNRDYWYNVPDTSIYSNNFSRSRSTATTARLNHPTFGTTVPGLCTNGDDNDLFYTTGAGAGASSVCQFNHSATSANLTSTENTSAFGRADYEINDDWMVYFTPRRRASAGTQPYRRARGRVAPSASSPAPRTIRVRSAATIQMRQTPTTSRRPSRVT